MLCGVAFIHIWIVCEHLHSKAACTACHYLSDRAKTYDSNLFSVQLFSSTTDPAIPFRARIGHMATGCVKGTSSSQTQARRLLPHSPLVYWSQQSPAFLLPQGLPGHIQLHILKSLSGSGSAPARPALIRIQPGQITVTALQLLYQHLSCQRLSCRIKHKLICKFPQFLECRIYLSPPAAAWKSVLQEFSFSDPPFP